MRGVGVGAAVGPRQAHAGGEHPVQLIPHEHPVAYQVPALRGNRLVVVGYDDEAVAAQSWDLVRDGVLVGYQLDRVFAPRMGLARSNGCSYADSAHHVPIQRMANVSL